MVDMRRFAAPTALGALLLMCAGCSGEDSPPETVPEAVPASSVTAIPGGPRLLARTTPPENGIGRDANVSGLLDVNAKDCFTVSGRILIAPYGSNIVDGGEGIDMPRYGRFKVGETVSAGGGVMPAIRPEVDPAWKDCIVDKKRDYFVFPNSIPH